MSQPVGTGGIVDSLIGIADSLYGVRDAVGANIELTYLVTRTWSGAVPGDGTYIDDIVQLLPSPGIKQLKADWKAREAGLMELGDTMLTGISKQSHFERSSIDCTSELPNVERFYKISNKLYSVVSVEDHYISWDVRIRKLANQG